MHVCLGVNRLHSKEGWTHITLVLQIDLWTFFNCFLWSMFHWPRLSKQHESASPEWFRWVFKQTNRLNSKFDLRQSWVVIGMYQKKRVPWGMNIVSPAGSKIPVAIVCFVPKFVLFILARRKCLCFLSEFKLNARVWLWRSTGMNHVCWICKQFGSFARDWTSRT